MFVYSLSFIVTREIIDFIELDERPRESRIDVNC